MVRTATIAGLIGMLALSAAATDAQQDGVHTMDAQSPTPPGRAIQTETTVFAPVEKVWRAWTTTEGVISFFADNACLEFERGGKFEIYFDMTAPEGSRGSEGCEVLAWQPHRMLAFTWNAPPKFPNVRKQRTQVILLFDALAPDRTRVRLTQHGWGTGDEWDQVFEYFSAAWPRVLQNLKSTLESQAAVAAAGSSSESAPKMTQWLCLLRPQRETFMQDATDAENAKIGEHYQRLVRLLEEGTLILAGPALDGKGPGILVFEAPDEVHAWQLVREDPCVKAGIFTAELHPYRVSLLRGR